MWHFKTKTFGNNKISSVSVRWHSSEEKNITIESRSDKISHFFYVLNDNRSVNKTGQRKNRRYSKQSELNQLAHITRVKSNKVTKFSNDSVDLICSFFV